MVRWIVAVGAAGLSAVLLVGRDVNGFRFGPVLALVAGMLAYAGLLLTKRGTVHDLMAYYLIIVSPAFGVVLWLAGPRFEATIALIPAACAASFLLYRRRTATIVIGLMLVGYVLLVSLASGYPRPAARVVLLLGICLASADLFVRLAGEMKKVADREHEAHEAVETMRAQLADANSQLEVKVADQGGEIARLGRLRRFLSPQIADTVLSEGADELLATHRRQIAVIFVDLRGFTGFSAVAEPEDVVELLSEFFAAVGTNLKRLDATVGGFAGDSVMAYFNDPVPCDDPAGRALDAAQSLKVPMEDLSERWRRRGFQIGYGVGIAYGYATLGIIGFEERNDYTPIGSVVNLASRLCDEAGPNELLLDGRAYEAVRDNVAADELTLSLKGFGAAVTAHRVAL